MELYHNQGVVLDDMQIISNSFASHGTLKTFMRSDV